MFYDPEDYCQVEGVLMLGVVVGGERAQPLEWFADAQDLRNATSTVRVADGKPVIVIFAVLGERCPANRGILVRGRETCGRFAVSC